LSYRIPFWRAGQLALRLKRCVFPPPVGVARRERLRRERGSPYNGSSPGQAYCRGTEPFRLSLREFPMSDKSPRKSTSKKSGTSIKERRAAKRSHETEGSLSDKIHPTSKR